MTPKSLLRHKLAVSKGGRVHHRLSFHRVLWDDAQYGNSDTSWLHDDKIKRVVMCSGKVYYDLLEERDARGIDDTYLMRFEQFYPFPAQSAVKELGASRTPKWSGVRKNPKTKAAGPLSNPTFEWVLGRIKAKHGRPSYAGRAQAPRPQQVWPQHHKAQQAALIDDALTLKGK